MLREGVDSFPWPVSVNPFDVDYFGLSAIFTFFGAVTRGAQTTPRGGDAQTH